jgi:hypothetical protein
MSTRSLSSSFLAALACILLALPALADSQARIVRLSDVHGTVQIDKNTGLGFENAFLNLPVTQGTQLKTLGDGRAEIEFEDGSTLRLGPNSSVEFSRLGLSDSGKRISAVTVASGMAYVNWLGKDDFSLNFSHEKVALDHAAHFRVDESASAANLAVFKGDVEVQGPDGNVKVEKNKTAAFDANDKSTLANKIVSEPLDSWDKESISYHDQYAKNSVSSPYGYGLSDLNYYGAYTSVPGYGMMWQPYFTGVGWDPFMDGAWGFYPGMGYMFASAYPWGWLPYRYGNWMFIPGFGWMWQPGAWSSYMAAPRYTATNLVTVHALVAPTEGVKAVVVGKGGSLAKVGSSRVVNAGSAGLGIQRGSLEDLKGLNHQVAKSGFAEVHPAPQFAATSHANAGFGSERGDMSAGSASHAGAASHAASAGGGGSTVRH